MATEDEKLLLKPAKAGHMLPSEGARRTAALRIKKLVVARLREFYDSAAEVPRELGKGNLTCSSLENRMRDIAKMFDKKTKEFSDAVAKAPAFSVWRERHEAEQAEAGPAGSPSTPGSAKRKQQRKG